MDASIIPAQNDSGNHKEFEDILNFIELKPGISAEGDQIKAHRSDVKGSEYIYLMAGVHGDEVEGVYCLQQLYNWLQDEDEFELPIIVIPILNVDGYRTGTRTNAHGVDLNRNLPAESWESEVRAKKYHPGPSALSEPENKFLNRLFAKYPPKLILTFHSWKPMINFNGDCRQVAEHLEQYNSYPVHEDIEGHPTPGSLGDYAPEKFNCPVLTFECPQIDDNKSLKDIWQENSEALKSLLRSHLVR